MRCPLCKKKMRLFYCHNIYRGNTKVRPVYETSYTYPDDDCNTVDVRWRKIGKDGG